MKTLKSVVKREDLLFIVLLAIFTYVFVWRYYPLEFEIAYWQWAPNRYRLWAQLMLSTNGMLGFSMRTWDCFGFIAFFGIAYWLIKPKQLDYTLLLAFPAFLAFGVFHSPMYALLAILVVCRESRFAPLLLFPLVLIKEISIWVGMLTLLLYSKQPRYAVVGSFIGAASLYGFVRFIVIGDVPSMPNTADWFTPDDIIPNLTQGAFINIAIDVAMLAFIVHSKTDLRNILLMVAPNFIVALWWEPQVWATAFLIILAIRSDSCRSKMNSNDMP